MHKAILPKQYSRFGRYLDESRDIWSNGRFESQWKARDTFTKNVSWHLPTKELIETLKLHQPILSVCSGLGYTESLAQAAGVNIVCTDSDKQEMMKGVRYYTKKTFMDVEIMDAETAVKSYPNRNVFMAWPPYDIPVASRVVRAMKNSRILIYVGEDGGGCTGDLKFHEYVGRYFENVDYIFRVIYTFIRKIFTCSFLPAFPTT